VHDVGIRKRLRLTQVGILVGVGVAAVAIGEVSGVGVLAALPATLVAWWLTQSWARGVGARANTELTKAVTEQRHEDALALMADIRELYAEHPKALLQLGINEASLLLLVGKNAEAVRLLESISPDALGPEWRPWHANNLAWSLLQVGEAERALPLARQSLELSKANPGKAMSGESLEASQLGTLGACLSATGAHEDAKEALDRSLAIGGTPTQQSARAFYLGEALSGLGRPDDASEAYARAMREAPEGHFAERAKKAREAIAAYR
jgi:tetratricopeptide (TPR) repeat protein